ncbi:HK97-gp10 family putative phage morphogenesis protein [Frigidibacter oleivorans]|uniref:HK97-gp10 family putative phage morphogenesis protein n=1 Tax=Frigidibacter oleivorans TaxID=2487129 RepID=UPI000F8F21AE|nr:HK97-gp10 family putative phage morphogenesis protein [Frigidibacter oleivorans]
MAKQTERLRRRLAAIPREVKRAVAPALVQGGDEIADTQRRLSPVDTGDLRASIAVTPPGQMTPPYSQPGGARLAGETEVLVTAGNSAVRYPHLVEFGTIDTVAQPFFWPGFRLARKRAQARVKRAIGKAVRDGWGRGA